MAIATGQTGDASDIAKIAPVGCVLPYAGSTAPEGYLLCDGSAVSRTTYAALFAVVGTTFGVGDGSTTFNLPDLRGRIPLGKDNMGGTSANRVTNTAADTLGGSAGEESHTLTVSEMPYHDHGYGSSGANSVDTNDGTGSGAAGGGSGDGSWNFQGEGGGQAHNNMSPYLTLNYIIRHITYS